MTDTEALYDVREQTGNPEHASVDDVVALVIERVQNPRDDHEDAHFDRTMATIIDTHGVEPVSAVIHRVLVDNDPFWTATNDLGLRNVDGVRIGTAARWFLEDPVVLSPVLSLAAQQVYFSRSVVEYDYSIVRPT